MCLLLNFAPRAWAGDPELALSAVRLTRAPEASSSYFGGGLAGGDLDGDGLSDLIVGSRDQVGVYLGSPHGVGAELSLVVVRQRADQDAQMGLYGAGFAVADLDNDGRADLLVAAPEREGGVFIYRGGGSGIDAESELVLRPFDVGVHASAEFGYAISTGDVNGDGTPEVLVGAPLFDDDDSDSVLPGAAFLYDGGTIASPGCSEVRIQPPSVNGGDFFVHFGLALSIEADTNGDGYRDVAVGCQSCIQGCVSCGAVAVWLGGLASDYAGHAATMLYLEEPAPEGILWNAFGFNVDAAGDVDRDGYEDLVMGSLSGPVLHFGSPGGPTQEGRQWLADTPGIYVAGIGDLDGDGFDDVVVSGGDVPFNDSFMPVAEVLFGSDAGLDAEDSLHATGGEPGSGFGLDLSGVGDVNGDGRPEFAVGAIYEGSDAGAAYLFSPVCTWFLDADGDGHGDPATTLSDCHQQPGYAARADDCDDVDAAVHGDVWYPDADGDGHGVRVGGALACTQPANTAASAFDCDDADPVRNPDATDDDADGIDQDCDGHDGPWVWDTGDCGDDTAIDTAVDSAVDSAADSAGDSAADSATAPAVDSSGDSAGAGGGRAPDCGCAADPGGGGAAGVAIAVALLRRARRCCSLISTGSRPSTTSCISTSGVGSWGRGERQV